MKEIRERLTFLSDVGVGYLQLDRAAKTLSGGEAQRLRLATQIGSQLVGVLYILDEPSIGLHQRDNDKLIGTLQRLKALGNTVLVVEHDEQMMRVADWVVDMGPGAGEHGGQVVAEGTAKQVMRTKGSVTGDFLSGRRTIAIPPRREDDRGVFTVRGAAQHNLKGIDVEFPVGKFITVTGVSGSGKSTLVNEIVYKALANRLNKVRIKPGEHEDVEGIEVFDKVIDIDQTPIGRTPRSNPATYTDLFTHVRELYSLTPEAKVRGYKPGRFSFNVRGGRCETCKGDGQIKIEMHFLPDVYVPCETCHGKRYNKETLEVRFKGKSISDVLEMSVEEALDFFARIPKIHRRLQTLHDVGLDYIRLGQPATTLSGGEAQRVKLASELSKVATGRTLYILDEPTTGLHFADIEKLLEVLQRLVDTGNTVLVIEHNLDVIKQADWIVDLGPEGGEAGGELIATGTPEEIAAVDESYTGQFLRGVLAGQGTSGRGGLTASGRERAAAARCRAAAAARSRLIRSSSAPRLGEQRRAASSTRPASERARCRSRREHRRRARRDQLRRCARSAERAARYALRTRGVVVARTRCKRACARVELPPASRRRRAETRRARRRSRVDGRSRSATHRPSGSRGARRSVAGAPRATARRRRRRSRSESIHTRRRAADQRRRAACHSASDELVAGRSATAAGRSVADVTPGCDEREMRRAPRPVRRARRAIAARTHRHERRVALAAVPIRGCQLSPSASASSHAPSW